MIPQKGENTFDFGCISQAEGGTDKFEAAKGSGDGGLGDVLGVHRDLVVAPDRVHF